MKITTDTVFWNGKTAQESSDNLIQKVEVLKYEMFNHEFELVFFIYTDERASITDVLPKSDSTSKKICFEHEVEDEGVLVTEVIFEPENEEEEQLLNKHDDYNIYRLPNEWLISYCSWYELPFTFEKVASFGEAVNSEWLYY